MTSHPSAFTSALNQVERSLRCQSHPNFIRHALTNANDIRLRGMRWFGIITILIAILVGVLLTLSSKQRWWRVTGGVPMMGGVVALVNGCKGICLFHVMLGFKRTVSPWELSPDRVEPESGFGDLDMEMRAFATDVGPSKDWMKEDNPQSLRKSMQGKRVSTEEIAIIKAQRWIVVQSMFFASCASFVYCAIFLSLPVVRII